MNYGVYTVFKTDENIRKSINGSPSSWVIKGDNRGNAFEPEGDVMYT